MKQARLTYFLIPGRGRIRRDGLRLDAEAQVAGIKVPFTGGAPAGEDPQVPFDVRRPLAYGQTLEARGLPQSAFPLPSFQGHASWWIRRGSFISRGAGDVRVGGRSAYDAVRAIEAAFSRELRRLHDHRAACQHRGRAAGHDHRGGALARGHPVVRQHECRHRAALCRRAHQPRRCPRRSMSPATASGVSTRRAAAWSSKPAIS